MNDSKKTANCQIAPVFCVYVIWCSVTNMYYVGVTRQKATARIKQHKKGKKQFIDTEIKRIGWEGNWDWWLVEENIPAEMVTEREQYWVKFFNSVYPQGYNRTRGGLAYFDYSEDVCKKISKALTGKKRPPFTEEHRSNLSKAQIEAHKKNAGRPAWNRGIPCTEEAKAKIRKKLCGRKRPDQSERMKGAKHPKFGKHLSEETKAKLRAKALERDVRGERNPHFGKKHSAEVRAAQSERMKGAKNPNFGKPPANKGVPHTEETRAKISAKLQGEKNPFFGRHHTEEAKEKNRQAHLGKTSPRKGCHLSEETKAKLREQALERDMSGEKNPFFGRHHSEETKEKLRQANRCRPAWNKGKTMSEESRAKMREAALARIAAKKNKIK